MTAAELIEIKALGLPVILKANPPSTYADAKYKRVVAVVARRIDGRVQPVAVLEDYCGRSLVCADPSHIIRAEENS